VPYSLQPSLPPTPLPAPGAFDNAPVPGPVETSCKLHLVPPLVRAAVRALGFGWEFRTAGMGRLRRLIAAGTPMVGAFFHGRQPCIGHWFGLPDNGPWTVLCSRSLDGEMQHRILSGLGYPTVRGSNGRGEGGRALVSLVRAIRDSAVPRIAMAVDGGGKGPRERVKPGIVALCAKTGAAIVPLGAAAANAFVASRAWDRMHVPRPGDRVAVIVGPPIAVPRGLKAAGIEKFRAGLEGLMLAYQRRAESLIGARRV